MATFAERFAAAAKGAKVEKAEVAAGYKIKPWIGGKGALENKAVLGRLTTLDQVLAWGADPAKVLASLDLTPSANLSEDQADIIRDMLGEDISAAAESAAAAKAKAKAPAAKAAAKAKAPAVKAPAAVETAPPAIDPALMAALMAAMAAMK